jgi:hypothetical protein
MTTTQTDIITRLESHIIAECKEVDRESRFDDMLDECYSFESVGGPFANMSPSQVLREVDPTAHRCGVNDYADSERWVEVGGEYYDQDEAEKAKQEFLDELESEASELESEIEEMEAEDEDEREPDYIANLMAARSKLRDLQADIAAVEKHSF